MGRWKSLLKVIIKNLLKKATFKVAFFNSGKEIKIMKVWILQKRNSEYSKYISILNIYESELEALRELNKMTDRYDIEVVGYEVIKESINEGGNLPFYGGRIKDKK